MTEPRPTGTGRPGGALTERYLLVLGDDLLGDDDTAARTCVQELTGLAEVTSSRDPLPLAPSGFHPTLLDRLGVAVAELDPDRLRVARADRRLLAVEPERVQRALGSGPGLSADYLRGFADAATFLRDRAIAGETADAPAPAQFGDTEQLTWGLQTTGVDAASETGAGIGVAVLDTGLDLGHPDFADRELESRSFVDGQEVQDVQGHGTHCVGADLDEVSAAYENAGRRALDAGVLIIAAAGNNAERSAGNVGFVGVPANSPSIMAVGAVDAALTIADFSAASSAVDGGQVDIAGPGVDVYSSWPMPQRNGTISGTSMATPHVSGIAALLSQRTGARGRDLWTGLTQAAQRLPLPSGDVGAGLVRAVGS